MSLSGILSQLPATIVTFLQQQHPVVLCRIYDTDRKIRPSDVNPLTPCSLSTAMVVTVGARSLTRYLDYLTQAERHTLFWRTCCKREMVQSTRRSTFSLESFMRCSGISVLVYKLYHHHSTTFFSFFFLLAGCYCLAVPRASVPDSQSVRLLSQPAGHSVRNFSVLQFVCK